MTWSGWEIWTPGWRPETGRRLFHALGIACTVIATIWMYAFGTGDPAEMKYLLGMPMWVSGAILIYLAMFVAGMIYLAKWEEFPLHGPLQEKPV